MNGDQTINLNNAQCLKESASFQARTVYNVCTGTTTQVPFGDLDVMGICIIGFVMLLGLVMAGTMIFKILTD